MIPDWHGPAFRAALKMIENGPPKNLVARVQPEADDHGETIAATDLTALIEQAKAPDPLLTALGLLVHKWDAEPATTDWTGGTTASTVARRDLICQKLGLNSAGAAALLAKRPIFTDPTIVITAPWQRWYDANVIDSHAFYWPHYMDYLLNVRKWPEENVTTLDLATTSVIERLSDPTRVRAHQAKGLVVGYVQSGKTANFTGVIAKALDAGYRLVIVMTGTIEMLRAQTQRRVDMEMVGRQNIVADLTPEQARGANLDYQNDPDWNSGRFLDLGPDPIESEILRLTTHKHDYQKQFKNLKIERFDMSKPLYDPANLFSADARLVITKKNSAVLGKLVTDLQANKKAFAEIPVLIIDDESDQASVNTVNPEKVKAAKREGAEVKERRAINERIAQMLTLMPRAQYVGYTATPFANVFVDPSDEQGIYPKDFVIGLERPAGYMGVEDFHDLDETEAPLTPANSNYAAYVRDLVASEQDDDIEQRNAELARALDMFVLTGACKLYRESQPAGPEFRHHTMLVHESVNTTNQKDLAETVRTLWTAASFSTPASLHRLRDLYNNDIIPVSAVRREPEAPPLPDFDSLKPWIAKAIGRIMEHNKNPVLVVNSDKEIQQQQQLLDFDRYSTWRVLVGGAKLSRGFTVEGLTITYFRRAVTMSDSLTQMGRWFGFRKGYRDLVRLFIDRDAKFGARRVDLYKAFEAVALDEAAFREQLSVYAEWDGDKPRVLPSQIPPLVSQHLPWLKPTARNKMFNAALEEQSDQILSPAGYPNHIDDQIANLELWRKLLAKSDTNIAFPAAGQTSLRAFIGVVDAAAFVDLIEKMTWMYFYGARSVTPKLKYYRRLLEMASPPLRDFLIVMPQPGDKVENIAGVGNRKIINRDRRARGGDVVPKFGEITDPKHRTLIKPLLGSKAPVGRPLADQWADGRGVVLAYLVREQHPKFDATPKATLATSAPERGLIIAFSMYLPDAAVGNDTVLRFRVLHGDDPSIVSVDVDSDSELRHPRGIMPMNLPA
ncbi:Z1 domain-containing protein [Rhodococcus sp. JVH1]|uniref:Z1 domain-containing protein n=1 Tax=Rhodococcus sp. JVH1 TaxID=745408 RepID=UPI0002720294|nr:Z1 domain-containing protein [Rhodococcus sp. JVH1]EJJ00191.1 endonuclease [Rhodococcus sp. JVH1]